MLMESWAEVSKKKTFVDSSVAGFSWTTEVTGDGKLTAYSKSDLIQVPGIPEIPNWLKKDIIYTFHAQFGLCTYFSLVTHF